jgi:hypothetical protein
MTKLFQVKIRAYGYKADFDIEASDTAKDIENAILSSLDPQTAQIALAAVNPYFNQTQNNINKNGVYIHKSSNDEN